MIPLSNGVSVPLRVAVADDSELVVRGLQAMLAERLDEVVLVTGGSPGSVEPASDLVLYDPAYVLRRSVRSGSPSAPVAPGRARVVAYSGTARAAPSPPSWREERRATSASGCRSSGSSSPSCASVRVGWPSTSVATTPSGTNPQRSPGP